MALVHQIIDFVDDLNHSILKEAAAVAPGHLKAASILTVEERERLEPQHFALVMHTKEAQVLKKFPITDEANTWLSARYFEKTSEQLPFVAQKVAATNLKRACLIYGIGVPQTVDKLASAEIQGNRYAEVKHQKEDKMHTQSVKTASSQPDGSEHFFALGGRYPMPNKDYVKKAAAYFQEHHREFGDAEDRATFATNVRERAKELEVELEKKAEATLATYDGAAYGDSVERQLKLREELLQYQPTMVSAIQKLASHKGSTEPQVFAKALHLFDKRAGVTKYYDGYIADAFKATFGNFRKTAYAGYVWEDEQSGMKLDATTLEKAAEDKYDRIKSYFGGTLADSLKKHAVAIFESLPSDAKMILAKIAKGTL